MVSGWFPQTAQSKGVLGLADTLLMSAPHWSRTRMVSGEAKAACNGVHLSPVLTDSTSAPASASIRTISAWPLRAAVQMGAQPSLSGAWRFAPLEMR